MTELDPVEGRQRETNLEIMTELDPGLSPFVSLEITTELDPAEGRQRETNLETITELDPVEGTGRQT